MDISFKRSCPGFGKADEDTLTAAREFVDPDAVHINQRQHISNVHQLQLCFPVRKKDGGWWLLFFRLQNSKQIWRMFQNYLILMQNTCHNCLFSSFPPELFFHNFQECKMRSNIFFRDWINYVDSTEYCYCRNFPPAYSTSIYSSLNSIQQRC